MRANGNGGRQQSAEPFDAFDCGRDGREPDPNLVFGGRLRSGPDRPCSSLPDVEPIWQVDRHEDRPHLQRSALADDQ
jgi:hypothetical protein